MTTTTKRMSTAAGVLSMSFTFLFLGLASAAGGKAAYQNYMSRDTPDEQKAAFAEQMGQAFACAFITIGALFLLIISIRLFTMQQRIKMPELQ